MVRFGTVWVLIRVLVGSGWLLAHVNQQVCVVHSLFPLILDATYYTFLSVSCTIYSHIWGVGLDFLMKLQISLELKCKICGGWWVVKNFRKFRSYVHECHAVKS